jgi:hypothetical protein
MASRRGLSQINLAGMIFLDEIIMVVAWLDNKLAQCIANTGVIASAAHTRRPRKQGTNLPFLDPTSSRGLQMYHIHTRT